MKMMLNALVFVSMGLGGASYALDLDLGGKKLTPSLCSEKCIEKAKKWCDSTNKCKKSPEEWCKNSCPEKK